VVFVSLITRLLLVVLSGDCSSIFDDCSSISDFNIVHCSILHLCCISMDRYIAIMKPLQYERKMTKFRALSMLTITWIASLLISYIPIHSQLYTTNENALTLKNNPYTCMDINLYTCLLLNTTRKMGESTKWKLPL
jgi:hypothetical protein